MCVCIHTYIYTHIYIYIYIYVYTQLHANCVASFGTYVRKHAELCATTEFDKDPQAASLHTWVLVKAFNLSYHNNTYYR